MTEVIARERSIIMTGDSVRAILDDRKTQTRRVVKPQPVRLNENGGVPGVGAPFWTWDGVSPRKFVDSIHAPWPQALVEFCPFGAVGDRLWVRETWEGMRIWGDDLQMVSYRADGPEDAPPETGRWRSPIHMPRSASRLTLELTAVRVERLNDITEADAQAEGMFPEFEVDIAAFRDSPLERFDALSTYRLGFKHAWDAINAERGFPWSSNPWVWAVAFKRVV